MIDPTTRLHRILSRWRRPQPRNTARKRTSYGISSAERLENRQLLSGLPAKAAPLVFDFFNNLRVTLRDHIQDSDLNRYEQKILDKVHDHLGGISIETQEPQGPSVAVAPDGSLVATWESPIPNQSGSQILAQRFADDGTTIGDTWRVDSAMDNTARHPSIAIADDGEVLITWQSRRQADDLQALLDGDGWDVFARRFAADGSPVGETFQVNTTTSGSQHSPTVVGLPDGGYAIAWTGTGGVYQDWSGVFLRIYGEDGNPLSEEIAVNQSVFGQQQQPTLTVDAEGGLVVAWSGAGTGDFTGIYARQFTADGMARSNEILVNSSVGGFQEWQRIQNGPSVSADSDGGFVVAWQGQGDGDRDGIFFRHFNASGIAVTEELLANETTTGRQQNPSVLVLSTGYVVAWDGYGTDDEQGVFLRRFDRDGSAQGPQERVNDETAGEQFGPGLVRSDSGFSVAWTRTSTSAPQQVFWRHFPANTPPEISVIADQTVGEGTTVAFTATATDPDVPDQTLSWSLESGAPAGATINATTGEFAWTPQEADGPATFDITIRVTDSEGASDTAGFQVVVEEINVAPVVQEISDQTVAEGATLTLTAIATDMDVPAQTLTWSLDTGAPTGATIDPATGSFAWTPDETTAPGVFSVTVRATDSAGADDFQTFQITVTESNVPPAIQSVANRTVAEGDLLSFTAMADDDDVPSQTLTWSLDDGAPDGATIDSASGLFEWTPDEAAGPGMFDITIRVTDSEGASDSTTFQVVVTEVNTPPLLAPIADRTVTAGEQLELMAMATDADQPAQTLIWSINEGAPAGATIQPNSGLLEWTPAPDTAPGTFEFTVSVTDGAGAGDSQTFQVTVTAANPAPDVQPVANQTVVEGNLLTFTATATDASQPSQTLTWSLDNGAPTGASIDPTTGVFQWTPTEADGPGTSSVTIRVTDSAGASDSVTFQITVTESDSAPVLQAIGSQTTAEGQLLTFTAVAADSDVPVQTLTWSLGSGAPAEATIDAATGVFTWTPGELDGPGTHNITVRVTDPDGLFAEETFQVTVTEVNQPPLLAPINDVTVEAGDMIDVQPQAIDPDNLNEVLTWSLENSAPDFLNIDPTTGRITGTVPANADIGTQLILVQATDSTDLSNSISFRLTVTEPVVNTPPVVNTIDNQTIAEGTELTLTATAMDPDVPDQTLTWSLEAGAPAGSGIDPQTGVFRWTPGEAAGPGTFTVTVRATDSEGASDTQQFEIEVTEVNQPPVLQPIGNRTASEGVLLTFTASTIDPDVPQQMLTWSLDNGAPLEASINADTGVFEWTPKEADGPGVFQITVRVVDAAGAEDSETLTVTVLADNTPPVVNSIADVTVVAGNEVVVDATATDPDLPQDTLTWSLDPGAPSGATIDSVTGEFRWTPDSGLPAGAFSVTVRVTDNAAASNSESFTINVTENTQAPQAQFAGVQSQAPAPASAESDSAPQDTSFRTDIPPLLPDLQDLFPGDVTADDLDDLLTDLADQPEWTNYQEHIAWARTELQTIYKNEVLPKLSQISETADAAELMSQLLAGVWSQLQGQLEARIGAGH